LTTRLPSIKILFVAHLDQNGTADVAYTAIAVGSLDNETFEVLLLAIPLADSRGEHLARPGDPLPGARLFSF